jgi:hypothetical protein
VDSSKIEGELVVDKHPHIIISSKFELFVSSVSELQVRSESESVVSSLVEVSKAFPVDWIEVLIIVSVNLLIANFSNGRIVGKDHVIRNWDIKARSIHIPIGKLRRTRDRSSRRIFKCWSTNGSVQVEVYNSNIVGDCSLKVYSALEWRVSSDTRRRRRIRIVGIFLRTTSGSVWTSIARPNIVDSSRY